MPGYTVALTGGGEGPATSITGLIKAGKNITITGTGTLTDPFVVAAHLPARGTPVDLVLVPPAQELPIPTTVTRNPDGSAALGGAFHLHGPLAEGQNVVFSNLPDGYAPAIGGVYASAAYVVQPFGLFTALVNLNGEPDREMSVDVPEVPAGSSITVYLDGVVFWPAST